MTNDEAVCLSVLFLYVLPRHTNIITDKGFHLFDECLHPLKKKSAFLLREGTVKFTHLAA